MRRGQPSMSSSRSVRYLFAGDSLTEGVCGESYVERVRRCLGPTAAVLNAGRGGDTARSLLARIEAPLRDARPQWVVLAIGTNDVWFRWLSSHSLGWWLRMGVRSRRTGQVPAGDLDRFGAAYRALIDLSRSVCGAQVLACTISPIGEVLSSSLNRQVARVNGVIQHVSIEGQVRVADVWQRFVEQLAVEPRRSGFLPRTWWSSAVDRRQLRRLAPDQLAWRRKLLLTYDGIHLNSRGADLWAATILKALCDAGAVPRKGTQTCQ
jgi:lysophospholipase L1-like esterase